MAADPFRGPGPGPTTGTPAEPLRYDLVVIGAGATGLGAARAAARGGRRVALVEAARTGGDCTHYGCVPSKALLEAGRRIAAARSGDRYGFRAQVEVDFGAVLDRVAQVITAVERDESPALLRRQGIAVHLGRAALRGPGRLDVTDANGRRSFLSADRLVLAVGSQPALPPVPGLAEHGVLTTREIFALRTAPEQLVVLGGGPVGCELAQAFARLGVPVTLIEAAPRLLSREEPEASRAVATALSEDGVHLHVGTSVVSVEPGPVLRLSDGTLVRASHVLAAAGRRPDTTGLGLATIGAGVDGASGRIVVDAQLRTSAAGVFAAGDCASPLQFTHTGDEQGRLAAANAFRRRPSSFDARVVPWVTFTEPEVGRVGLTEAEAFTRWGGRARVAFVPLSGQDRARAAGERLGFVKLISGPRRGAGRITALDEVVGFTAVGPVGGELIAEVALAMRGHLPAGRLAQTVHAYPTWSLSTRVAAAGLFGTYGERGARPARATPGPPSPEPVDPTVTPPRREG